MREQPCSFDRTNGSQVDNKKRKMPFLLQTLMFSATYTPAVFSSIQEHMRDPQFLLISADDPSLVGVKQFYSRIDKGPTPYHEFRSKVSSRDARMQKRSLSSLCLYVSPRFSHAHNLCLFIQG